MKHSLHTLVLVATVHVVLVSPTALAVPDSLRGIVGNVTDVGRNFYPPVGLLVSKNSAGETGLCTGCLVQGGNVLTAAHCVDDAVSATFFYGGLGGQAFAARTKAVHPEYRNPGPGAEPRYQFDLAVLDLGIRTNGLYVANQPNRQGIFTLALPRNDHNYRGDHVLFVGFGNKGNGSIGELPAVTQDEQKHFGWSRVDWDSGDGYLGFRFDPGEAIIGRGDSGGPVVDASTTTTFQGQTLQVPTVVGVNSHVFARENPDGTLQTVFGTRGNSVKVQDHLEWIRYVTHPLPQLANPNAAKAEIQRNLARFRIGSGSSLSITDFQSTALVGGFDPVVHPDDLIYARGFELPIVSIPEPASAQLLILATALALGSRRRDATRLVRLSANGRNRAQDAAVGGGGHAAAVARGHRQEKC